MVKKAGKNKGKGKRRKPGPVPIEGRRPVNFNLPVELVEDLDTKATELGISRNAYVTWLLGATNNIERTMADVVVDLLEL